MKRRLLACFVMLVLAVVFAVSANAAATELSTAADIIDLMNTPSKWNGDYVLTNDIDLRDYTGTKAQARIGNNSTAFTGTFDGAGYAIRGVDLVGTSNRWGFFGWVYDATIENLTLFGHVESSRDGVGGIVGLAGNSANTDTIIRNCVNYCSVKTTYVSAGRAGGIVGVFGAGNKAGVNVTIENCVNYGEVFAPKHGGGILARGEDGGTTANGTLLIKNCANFGTVDCGTYKYDGMGGIVAVLLPYNGTYEIENCYNGGAVTGGYAVGGILGRFVSYTGTANKGSTTINNCVNVGALKTTVVENTGTTGAVGGILGETYKGNTTPTARITIQNCFNSGSLQNPIVKKENCGMIYGCNALGTLLTCTTGNTYAAGTTATAGHNTAGGTAIAAADLGKASAYPATFNTDDTYLYSEDGPYMKAVHNEIILLDGTDCVCALCEKKLLGTRQINGETWIELSSAADLLLLMANSKAGNKDALSYNYILTKDIDLAKDERQYPIGQPNYTTAIRFEGKFDGQNYAIRGISMTTSTQNSFGLFGSVGAGIDGSGKVAEIKNLKTYGTVTSTVTSSFVGGVVGMVNGSLKMENVENNVAVTGVTRIGGVVGTVAYNVAAFYHNSPKTFTMINCVNNAEIISTAPNDGSECRMGGVVGQLSMGSNLNGNCVVTVENCVNNGDVHTVSGTNGMYIGGITSRIEPNYSKISVKKCTNNGDVSGYQNIGGISGSVVYANYDNAYGEVVDCVNNGTITGSAKTANTGGIIGWVTMRAFDFLIDRCINNGTVTGGGRLGGIVGYSTEGNGTKGSSSAAATTGDGTLTISNCLNTGSVTAGDVTGAEYRYGGIVGMASRWTGETKILNCANAGTVTAPRRAAGIIAYSYTLTPNGGAPSKPLVLVENCANAGKIVATDSTSESAGIVAIANPISLKNSVNAGEIQGAKIAGIIYWAASKVSVVEDAVQAGTLTGTTKDAFCVNIDAGSSVTGELLYRKDQTTAVSGATAIEIADAKEYLPTWCLTYGLNADSEDPAKSEHYRVGTNTKCLVCGAEKHELHAASVTMREEIVIVPTCMETGSKYEVCPICFIRGEESEVPVDPDNHEIGWDLADTVPGYGCIREGCSHVQTAVTEYTAVYVSATGDDSADGKTADTAVESFTLAMDIAALSGNDCTVYLIGKVSTSARQYDSKYNTFTNSFEETPHTKTITITSAEGQTGELHFTDAARRYFLYGPTTFENIDISCGVSKKGIYLFARGFKLVIGENVDVLGAVYTTETNEIEVDPGVEGLGTKVDVSVAKIYVYGGFYHESAALVGGYKDANMSTYHSDVTVLSGSYWTIAAFNRSSGTVPDMNGATAELTIGSIDLVHLCPTTSDTNAINDTEITVHYTGVSKISKVHRFAMQKGNTGAGNVANHIFYGAAKGTQFGDFTVDGSNQVSEQVNIYYAPEFANDPLQIGIGTRNARNAHAYSMQPVTVASLPELCVQQGGHNWVENACTVCGIAKCAGDNHFIAWDLSGEVASAKCIAGCDYTIDVSAVDAIYVSDNGKAGATGITADAPLYNFADAQAIAAKLGKDAYIYLTDTTTLHSYIRYIEDNAINTSHEETLHDNQITIATAPGLAKKTLLFDKHTSYYFLSGPTVFDNINLKATVAGTGKLVGDSADSGGIIFCGRGFDLTMGKGVAMPKITKNMSYTKDNSGITGLNATVTISDSKVYVFGGFQKNGYYPGITDADFASVKTNVTILNGTYWTIAGGNRGSNATARDGAEINLTIGTPDGSTRVQAIYIVPFSSDSATYTNSVANVHYTGKVTAALNYRSLFGGGTDSYNSNVNFFFHSGYNGSKIGDYTMGTRAPVAVNLYYATKLAENALINAFREKTDRYAATYSQSGEEMTFVEWCVERGPGHIWDENGVCTFCEIEECKHQNTAWSSVAEATCVATGMEANRCTVCFEHLEERVIPIDENAHDLVWSYGAQIVATCRREGCDYTVVKEYPEVTEIHVSSLGSPEGDMSANSPINDFHVAMVVAAAQDTPVTIYIHDIAVIPETGETTKWNEYVEPEHDNEITITSYGDTQATLRFNGETPKEYTILYVLSGPTTFTNLELSSWNTQTRFYLVARHNKLVLGEGMSTDYQRGENQSLAGSDIIIIGGCYGKDLSPAGGCEGLDTDVTVLSGSYGGIIGGPWYNNTCCVDTYTVKHDNGTPNDADDDYTTEHHGGDIHLTLGGDLMVRRQIYAGGYGNSSNYANNNDVYISIVGHISVASTFGFGPMGVYYTDSTKTETAPYMAKNVYLYLYDGDISGGSFYASNDPVHPFVLGAISDGATPTERISGKLYIYADGSNRRARAMYDMMVDTLGACEVSGDKWEATIWEQGYCLVKGGDHTPGELLDSREATCAAEGYNSYICTVCDKEYTDVLERLDHTFNTFVMIEATCIAPEMKKEICAVCSAPQFTVTGSAYGEHTEPVGGFCQLCNKDLSADCAHENATTEAVTSGCGTGTKWYCPDCDKTVVDVISDGHNYGKYTVTVEPTETQPGIKTRTCKGCGKVDTALLYATDAVNASAVATDANGNIAMDVAASKLTKREKAALNALLQQEAYGAEVKISYETDGTAITGITYSIPVPAEYTEYTDVRVVIKDEDGKIHFVDFKIEKGYIVFTF